MNKILIFGNSGSGKSTMARRLAVRRELAHLDLDDIAWKSADPPTRKPVAESAREILEFVHNPAHRGGWVIEGCYSSLLAIAAPHCSEMRFINPGIEACVENCRKRPWEPDKYESREAQDANLEMLIDWVREYADRNDEFSLAAHRALFDGFTGAKTEYRSNEESAAGS